MNDPSRTSGIPGLERKRKMDIHGCPWVWGPRAHWPMDGWLEHEWDMNSLSTPSLFRLAAPTRAFILMVSACVNMVVLPFKRSHSDVDSDEDNNEAGDRAGDGAGDEEINAHVDRDDSDSYEFDEDRFNRVWDSVKDESEEMLEALMRLGYEFHNEEDHEYWGFELWLFDQRHDAHDERPSTT